MDRHYSLQDGKHMLAAMSVEHPLCPPADGVKRAQVTLPPISTHTQFIMLTSYIHTYVVATRIWVAVGTIQRE